MSASQKAMEMNRFINDVKQCMRPSDVRYKAFQSSPTVCVCVCVCVCVRVFSGVSMCSNTCNTIRHGTSALNGLIK